MDLFVNGCSFLNHRHSNGIDVNFSTAEVIKDKCKFENMTNLARGGRGNDRIFLSTMAYFEGDSKQKKNTFVLIGWSASTRLDYPTREDFKPTPPLDQCWSTIKMFEHEKGFDKMARIKIDHLHWSITRYFQNVIGLQNYLKTNKIPTIKDVVGTNYCFFNVFPDRIKGRIIIISVIDNLIKGAAGQAIQNMNLKYKFKEDQGLDFNPVFP